MSTTTHHTSHSLMARKPIAYLGYIAAFFLTLLYIYGFFPPLVSVAGSRMPGVTHTVLFQWKTDASPEMVHSVGLMHSLDSHVTSKADSFGRPAIG
jgi:hypothetical protein